MKSNTNIFNKRGILLALIVLSVGILIFLFLSQRSQSETPALPSPLEGVYFPTQTISYPSDWLDELRYPEEFHLTEASSGKMMESEKIGWAAKLIYEGKLIDAQEEMVTFFESNGWQVVQSTQLDSGGSLIIINNTNGGSGMVVIDLDQNDPDYIRIEAVVFP